MLLTQNSGLLHRILSNEYSDMVHERLLLSLKDMMSAEESRLESTAAIVQLKESGLGAKVIMLIIGSLNSNNDVD